MACGKEPFEGAHKNSFFYRESYNHQGYKKIIGQLINKPNSPGQRHRQAMIQGRSLR